MTNNKGQRIGTGVANQKGYHSELWNQQKPDSQYFKELFRVANNQIVWGGNYFTDNLAETQCWIVWDKLKPKGVNFADCELAWTSFNERSRMFRFLWNGMLQGDMKNKEDRIHPTQKPVALYKWILSEYANKGNLILDTHVGSASSLIACEELGFDYVGFEIDEEYYRQAKERLDNFNAQIRMEL